MKIIPLIACLVVLLLILAPAPRAANADPLRSNVQEDRNDIIQRQFEAMLEVFAKHDINLRVVGAIRFGDMDQKESISREVKLENGKRYKVLGACDSNCKDLNIVVYDEDGSVIAEDVGKDDAPIVTMDVRRSGTYKLETAMVACENGPCRYGVGLYVQ